MPHTSVPARLACDPHRCHICLIEPITSTEINLALNHSRRLSTWPNTGFHSQRQAVFLRCRGLPGSMFSLFTISQISAIPGCGDRLRTTCGAQGVASLAGCDRTRQNHLQLARSLRGRRRTRRLLSLGRHAPIKARKNLRSFAEETVHGAEFEPFRFDDPVDASIDVALAGELEPKRV